MNETATPDSSPRPQAAVQTPLENKMKKGAGWVIALGAINILLGLFAISSPLFVGVAVQYFVGAALMIGGTLQSIHAIKSEPANRSLWAIFSGLLAVICGGIMIAKPLLGLGVITLFLIAYFISDGLIKIFHAFKHRPNPGWAWVLFSGLLTLILGLALWKNWPLSGAWAIGVLFGINLIFDGWAMIFCGASARKLIKTIEPVDV